jgi:hypothetical protein
MTATTGAGSEPCKCQLCLDRAEKGRVRAWRWMRRHSDLTEPPVPALRWALLLILGLCCWAAGIPLKVEDWLGPIIIAGALILPDIAGFGIAGVRLDLKQAKDDLAGLRQDVNNQARSTSTAFVAIGSEAVEALSRRQKKLSTDQASGPDTPLRDLLHTLRRTAASPPGVDKPGGQDIPS